MKVDLPERTDAALRLAQCLKEEGQLRLEGARKALSRTKESAEGQKLMLEGQHLLEEAVALLDSQVAAHKGEDRALGVRARMLYEAAWCQRTLLNMKKATAAYQALIDDFADLPLACPARLELAELLVERHEFGPVAQLLTDALDKEPTPELTEKIRLFLGATHSFKNNFKGAQSQFEAVAPTPKARGLMKHVTVSAGHSSSNATSMRPSAPTRRSPVVGHAR